MLATERPTGSRATASRSRRRTLTRSALITALFIAPAVVLRIVG